MHILGKVLLWLCVVLLIPMTLVLITMTLDVRHRWQQDVADRRAKVEKGLQQIADAQKRVRDLEESRQSLVHEWGDVWNAPNSGPIQGGVPGSVELMIGAGAGLPNRGQDGKTEPHVFAFADTPEGTQYLGEFGIADARPDRVGIRLSRAPYPQEAQSWPQGTYHIRATLPANWLQTFSAIEHQQASADAILTDQRLELATRKNQVKTSQATLDQRMAELNGNPKAAPDASDVVKEGLVAAVRKYEAVRNGQLTLVNQLRHRMVQEYNTMCHTIQRCVEKANVLEEKYGQPSSANPGSSNRNQTAASTLPGIDRE